MDHSGFRQRQYDPQHPHSGAAAAAQARIRQSSSFASDHPPPATSNSSSRTGTPSDPFRSRTLDVDLTSDIFGPDSSRRNPPSATLNGHASGTAFASPSTYTSSTLHHQSPVHFSSPLGASNLPMRSSSTASSSSDHSSRAPSSSAASPSLPYHINNPLVGNIAQPARSTSAHFSSYTGGTPGVRPSAHRSHTSGPQDHFSAFYEDPQTAAVFASPVDTPQTSSRFSVQSRRRSPHCARVAIADPPSVELGSAAAAGGASSSGRGAVPRSSTAGPSLWSSSVVTGNSARSSTPAATSSASSRDAWYQSRRTASPLPHPSRENSSSSDSGLVQNLFGSGDSMGNAFATNWPRSSRGGPLRSTTLASQQDLQSIRREPAQPQREATMPESVRQEGATVAVDTTDSQQQDPTQIHNSPISTSELVITPEEEETDFSLSSADSVFARQRRMPPRVQTRSEEESRFRAPQRAATFDPASLLTREVKHDEYEVDILSPIQDQSDNASSRQTSVINDGGVADQRQQWPEQDRQRSQQQQQQPQAQQQYQSSQQQYPSSADAFNQLALGGLFDSDPRAAWTARDASPEMFTQRTAPLQHLQAGVNHPSSQYHHNDGPAIGHYTNGYEASLPQQGFGMSQQQQQPPPSPQVFSGNGNDYGAFGGSLFRQQQQQHPHHQQQQHMSSSGQYPSSLGHIQHRSAYGNASAALAGAMSGLDLSNSPVAPTNRLPAAGYGMPAPGYGSPYQQMPQSAPPAVYPQPSSQRLGYESGGGYGLNRGQVASQAHRAPPYMPNGHSAYHRHQGSRSSGHHRAGGASMTPQQSNGRPRSALLEEFRRWNSNQHRPQDSHSARAVFTPPEWPIERLRGHVVEFCLDQHASRYLQLYYRDSSNDDKQLLFDEIFPEARRLMYDVFGNYVVQRVFQFGPPSHRMSLANEMQGHVLPLSLDTYACRVVQEAIQRVPHDLRISMARELEVQGDALGLISDQNANHVLQVILGTVQDQTSLRFISDAFRGKVLALGVQQYACRVLQKVLEHCDETQARPLLSELYSGDPSRMMADCYGNYVIQFILANGNSSDKSRIVNATKGKVLYLSRHKFASNVVQSVVKTATRQQRRELMEEVLQPVVSLPNQPHSDALKDKDMTAANVMMTDQYANYVLQTCLSECEEDQRARLVALLKPRLVKMRQGGSGGWSKHLTMVEKLVNSGSDHGVGGGGGGSGGEREVNGRAGGGGGGGGASRYSPSQERRGWMGSNNNVNGQSHRGDAE